MRDEKYDVMVIGAGAAGLLAAGSAAEQGARVMLAEKMNQPGRKVLISGKGRCNITNHTTVDEFMCHIFPDSRFLHFAFGSFFSEDIVRILKENGVDTVVERGRRIFPASSRSADVVNGLLKWLRKYDVRISTDTKVHNLLISDGVATGAVIERNGQNISVPAASIILATGGKSYPGTGSTGDGYRLAEDAGHTITDLRPALVPLETEGDIASRLHDLELKNVKVTVWINGKKKKEDFGEASFTKSGLSGPVILKLSRYVVEELGKSKSVEISIDLKPALDEKKLDARLIRDLESNGKWPLEKIFRLWLPAIMIPVFFEELLLNPLKPAHQINSSERKKILGLMKEMRFKISGHRSFKEALITAGGINIREINPLTMGSKIVRNLYFAGEVLDLDADTGGYNLQIAWSTGWLAGKSAAKNAGF